MLNEGDCDELNSLYDQQLGSVGYDLTYNDRQGINKWTNYGQSEQKSRSSLEPSLHAAPRDMRHTEGKHDK